MTPEEAIALAKAATRGEGWAWTEPVRALRCQAGLGLAPRGWFWEVFSSPGPDRWMTFVRLDEATREVRGLGRSLVA